MHGGAGEQAGRQAGSPLTWPAQCHEQRSAMNGAFWPAYPGPTVLLVGSGGMSSTLLPLLRVAASTNSTTLSNTAPAERCCSMPHQAGGQEDGSSTSACARPCVHPMPNVSHWGMVNFKHTLRMMSLMPAMSTMMG